MAKPLITEKTIRELANAKSFARGQEYFREGAVSEVRRRGKRVTAEVEGGDLYEVTISLDDSGVEDAECTCPYDWDGYCKHIVAVLLKLAHGSDEVTESPPVADMIRTLDRDDLAHLLVKRLESDRGLASWIEAELAAVAVRKAATSGSDGGKAVIDTGPIRKQARLVLAGRYRRARYSDGYRGGDISELRDLVHEAIPFLESGDGLNALRFLESVADAFVDNWIEHSAGSDEDMYELFADLGQLVAQAALMGDIPVDDRDAFKDAAEDWQSRLSEYGVEGAFDVAVAALESGWDDPVLQAILRGERKTWPRSGRDDWVEAELTALRLRGLEACGKTEEYLRLARAANARTDYAVMLVKLKRTADAVKYALKSFKHPDDSLDLAKALKNAGQNDEAIRIAEAGLGLRGDRDDDTSDSVVPLAHWLREFAGAARKPDLALKAAMAAFRGSLSLDDFNAVKSWAGSGWAGMREEMLATLRRAPDASERTEIFLSEGLIDEAVRSIDDDDFKFGAHDETLMRLAAAAHASHSDWVIKLAMTQATGIMEGNRAGEYALAAQWLEKAALAHEAAGREDAWMACLDDLIERHRRKHKLRPLLQELRGSRETTSGPRKRGVIERRRA
ncbi:MAG TPA: SWIM zinc finger family protein [Xanthobacteraceae bacterium]|nr:SWIM zinc finger family protein [Xanthobacteraceae bacterium]